MVPRRSPVLERLAVGELDSPAWLRAMRGVASAFRIYHAIKVSVGGGIAQIGGSRRARMRMSCRSMQKRIVESRRGRVGVSDEGSGAPPPYHRRKDSCCKRHTAQCRRDALVAACRGAVRRSHSGWSTVSVCFLWRRPSLNAGALARFGALGYIWLRPLESPTCESKGMGHTHTHRTFLLRKLRVWVRHALKATRNLSAFFDAARPSRWWEAPMTAAWGGNWMSAPEKA